MQISGNTNGFDEPGGGLKSWKHGLQRYLSSQVPVPVLSIAGTGTHNYDIGPSENSKF